MFRSNALFDKLLDKATSHLSLEPDLASIIQISDLIRQGDCPPKYALSSIKKKLVNQNAHTVNYALLVLESVVKNCGHHVHDEIATKQFMEVLRDLLKTTNSDQVKQKTLEMIQAWAHAFRTTPKYKAVQDMMMTLKTEGYKFPALKESDAMFAAETAPDWVDSPTCHRCRVQFNVMVRKHHCRACGNVFCGQCTGKVSTIPKFGIEKEVRVCETCYEQNKNRASSPSIKNDTEQLPAEYLNSSLAQQKQAPVQTKTAEELKEDEDLQLALALSQSEAEAKEKEARRQTSDYNQPIKVQSATKEEEDDEELSRYLNRSYWEQRQGQPGREKTASPDRYRNSPPSAPETPTHHMQENGFSDAQVAEFVSHLKSQVDVFVNRMKSNSSRGRSISNDSSVQSLFLNMTNNHSKLLEFISQQEEMRVHFEGLQDKLAQVKDAMAALEALRDEHQEKLRREAAEAERQKQMQMMQKLQIMRKKKQEYLQQQRELAIQRVQEQEREMQMRKEQQKQQYLMGGYNSMMGYAAPPGYPSQPAPVYLPRQPGTMASGYPAPMHQVMAVPAHMQPSRLPGPLSLPHQMSPQLQPQMQQQPMSIQHGIQQQPTLPHGVHQQPTPHIPNPQMQGPANLSQQMLNQPSIHQQMQPTAGIQPHLHNYPQGPQQPQSMRPIHGIHPQYPGMPQHHSMGPQMNQGQPISQGPPNSIGQGPPMVHVPPTSLGQGPPMGHNAAAQLGPGQGLVMQMQHGNQQYPQSPPGVPHEQSTAELIKFD